MKRKEAEILAELLTEYTIDKIVEAKSCYYSKPVGCASCYFDNDKGVIRFPCRDYKICLIIQNSEHKDNKRNE